MFTDYFPSVIVYDFLMKNLLKVGKHCPGRPYTLFHVFIYINRFIVLIGFTQPVTKKTLYIQKIIFLKKQIVRINSVLFFIFIEIKDEALK